MQAKKKIRFGFFSAFFPLLFIGTAFAQMDPPTRVLRLNYTNGNVSAQPAGVDEWGPAPVNRPFSIGDYLYTDQSSVAELVTDVGRIRMGQYTNFGVLNLTDTVLQLKMTEGDMYFRVHDFGPDQVFEVDTPNAAVTILRPGNYRIHVDPNQNTSLVVVRRGEAQITGGGQAFTLDSGNSATLSGTDQLAYDVEGAPAPDEFDNWAAGRDQRYERVRPRYVPTSMVGYEDLADNGDWSDVPQYGHVWYPRAVPSGWAPYHDGHWAWVEPWGWTWVDDAPWGFAPFHYGRWIYNDDRWGWTPGPEAMGGYGGGYDSYDGYGGGYGRGYVRPCYAPALVAWLGGSHFGIGISIGGGEPSVGWVPLGYGEVYTPAYQVSQNYFRNVNVSNTRIVNTTNITNVYNNVYVNKTAYNTTYVNAAAPNAVVAMPQNSFANGAPVAQRAVALQPRQVAQLRAAQPVLLAPSVAPTRQATMHTLGANAVRPPAQLVQRQVVARTAPPPPPAPFQARQAFLQQHAGQPVNAAAMRQAVAPQQAQARPAVTVVQAPAARPRIVQPGARVGNVPAAAVNNRVSANAGQAPPAQPQQFNRGVQAQQNAPIQNPGNRPGQAPAPAPANRPGQPAAVAPQGPAAPPPAVHGVPPNQRQSVPPQAAPAPAPQPGPRGVPPAATQPNRPGPVQQPRVVEPTPAPAAPNTHGVPPNQRQAVPPPATAPRATPAPIPQQREVQPPARPQQAPPPAYSRPEPARPAPAPPPQQREVQPPPRSQQVPPPAYSRPEPPRPAPAPPPQQREVQPAPRPQPAPPPAYSRPEPPQREVQPPPARPQQAPPPAYSRPEPPRAAPAPPPQQREVQPQRQAPPPPREAPPAHGTPPNQRENPRDTKPDHR